MQDFFVGYSYGMGGHWFYIKAPSGEQIVATYPGVGVWKAPSFFDKQFLNRVRENDTYLLGEVPELVHNVLLEASQKAVPSRFPSDF